MHFSRLLTAMFMAAILLTAAVPRPDSQEPNFTTSPSMLHGSPVTTSKAVRDTMYLLGGPGSLDGSFEDAGGVADWHGWTHQDISQAEQSLYWHISDHQPIQGSYSMWCGTWFDDDSGYGNGWTQNLEFIWPLPDAGEPVAVSWTGILFYDTEPGFDFVYLQAWQDGSWHTLEEWDGRRETGFVQDVILDPASWEGPEGPAIGLRFRFSSDSVWSDEDGLLDTDGAVRVDDLRVSINDVEVDFEDFENLVSDHWVGRIGTGVGDFSQIYYSMQDLDLCASNYTPQVAFIDDGIVVPGTGGSPCITWCYGPGGYVVNTYGGMSEDPNAELRNVVVSPVLEVPAGHSGLDLAMSVYLHEELAGLQWPGVFFFWEARGTAEDDPEAIESAAWESYWVYYYGGPNYQRIVEDISTYMPAGVRWAQVRLGVVDMSNIGWGHGHDATPAPYIDDVAIRSWALSGPAIAVHQSWLAQDTFPESGTIDPANPAANSCRFDMAKNISVPDEAANVPGDSLVFDVVPVRAGSILAEPPRMHVVMKPNPVFDDVRILPENFTLEDGLLRGHVVGWPVTHEGTPVVDRWAFDLPDTGFFYPGDEIRYFVEAMDLIGGDVGVSRLPADTTGLTNFVSDDIIESDYPDDFIVRALPEITILENDDYYHTRVLLWFDQNRNAEYLAWLGALRDIQFDDDQDGPPHHQDFDIYRTRWAGAGLGNGLGGRATAEQIAGYDFILYDCGLFQTNTLGVGEPQWDHSDDVALLDAWLTSGDKHLFMCGDNLVSSLANGNGEAQAFLTDHIGATLVDVDVSQYINNQYTPRVQAMPGASYPSTDMQWIAYGGCQPIRAFDAILPTGDAQRVAEFADPNGNFGVFPYAAGILNHGMESNSETFLTPMAFARIYSAPDWYPPAGYPHYARAALLYEWLPRTIVIPGVDDDGLPKALSVSAYPNPFNPRVTLALDLPKAATTSVKIYDIRGALVRSIPVTAREAGHHEVIWAGQDDRGGDVASGVYFYRVDVAGEQRQGKLTLVR